jgi:hypothetical protein
MRGREVRPVLEALGRKLLRLGAPVAVLVAALAAQAPDAVARPNYVALGDSYAAGP